MAVSTTLEPEVDTKLRHQPPYNVILLDDDQHTHAYVCGMLVELFAHAPPAALRMAEEVHKHGRSIVCTTSLERAELKQEQIHGYGPDPRIPTCKGAMFAKLEPAE